MKTRLSFLILLFGARALAAPLDVDQCLNDMKKVEAGISCLFASSSGECAKNYRATFSDPEKARAKDFWRAPLPGVYDSALMAKSTQRFEIQGPSRWADYVPWVYQSGITPVSYVVDASLVARFGFIAGGTASWTLYLAASLLPDQVIPAFCDRQRNAGHLAVSAVCSKSILRPAIYQLLSLPLEERRRALTEPSSSIYWTRFAVCRRYFATLAANLDHVFSKKIESCADGNLRMDGRDHRIVNGELHWETPNGYWAFWVLQPVTPAHAWRPFRHSMRLDRPIFYSEHGTVRAKPASRDPGTEGIIGVAIVDEKYEGAPPTDEHTMLWLNRTRIAEACGMSL